MISVVTPSFNMIREIPSCISSVHDQSNCLSEHIIQDAGSTDGTREWLNKCKGCKCFIESDQGMYDAINKGWCNALGDILCYLNCDEQYLPGMLEYVERYFVEHPEVDMIFGDVIVVNPEGQFLSYRKGYPVRWFYIPISLLYVYTCTMFFRRRIFDDGYFFDTSYKSVADADFVMRVQRAGYTIRHVKRYFSTFTFSGSNLSEQPVSVQEKRRLYARAPRWVKLLRHPLNAMRLVEKMIAGAYRQTSPLTYAIYEGQGERRKEFTVLNPGWRWPGDMQGQEAHVLKGAR